ncbi:DUF4340 domain-containing protein [Rubripirellula reticaptiva]|uniref:DUF4340 domain-containing protein n=1 Tax=Rubripirellula reticaptiva TaxID=2528013 RepID=A0A5C6EFX2_9BACT|nr:DUF4340 domain-containing protein [Rubripirellula reticaptiva]TWU47688.1 hypothetical protein Poly59_45290 [Rubripirellula reticaptiva]
MNEGKKTGLFWVAAVATAAVATFVSWPREVVQTDNGAGQMLFEKFTDPLAAASMKIVTFDEAQGTLDTFEVRKDKVSGQWTIPSREGYPADALEQMKDAANALVGVKILDIQTSNAEDHNDLGVAEPALEDLEVGDEGVGRLVTFKNEAQETLASLIIGDSLKDDPTKRFVRIPNQDPVYVVKFDESPLTTNFRDWIEDDLLQLSSIDIDSLEMKDYTATLGQGGISLSRKYTAEIAVEGAQYSLTNLLEFDPRDPRVEPKNVEAPEGQSLNKTKLNELKNALDDLKIVNVFRKPEGVSATLKASKDLLSDQAAIESLAQRGFYPIDVGPDGEAEILSANGELAVSLKDGVKYLIRFGNIAGVSDSGDAADEGAEKSDGGVNRYLFVTTMVDDSKFPAPELREIPQTLEDLEMILNPPKEVAPEADTETAPVGEVKENNAEPADDPADESKMKEEADKPATEEMETEEPVSEESEESAAEESVKEEAKSENPETESAEEAAEESGETETEGQGEATGKGEAQDDGDDEAKADSLPETETKADADAEAKPADAESAAEMAAEETPANEKLTDEELQERLEAEQEKITKENQRMLDARKDQIEIAERKVRELNERFADWYYVIPEDTYSKLTIKRDDLFESASDAAAAEAPGQGGPQFNIPGFPGN